MGTLRAGSRGLRSVFGPSSQQLSWSRVPQRSVPAQGLLVQALGAPGPTAEACRAAVTPVCTTDALDGQKRGVKVGHGTTGPTAHTQPWGWGWGWGGSTDLAVGTAGPASKTVSAAGIVVVAEAPFPTRHVAHTGQVGGREGRVLLLLTCSGLHVAGVASRAAVLAVLTAHGLGEERCYTPLPPPTPAPQVGSLAIWLPVGELATRWALTWGSWQQAQPLLRLGQQVCPTGQLVCWSQPVVFPGWDAEARRVGILFSPVTMSFFLLQCPLPTHVWPLGQQYWWSEQQTAWGRGREGWFRKLLGTEH